MGKIMDLNDSKENSTGMRGVISVMGLIVVLIGMVASIQVENSIVPPAMIIIGTIIILIAEKSTLDERLH